MFVVIKNMKILFKAQYLNVTSSISGGDLSCLLLFMFLCHCCMITGVNCNLEKRLVLLSAFSEGFFFFFLYSF